MRSRLIEPRELLRAVVLPALASAAAATDEPRLQDPRAAILLAAIAIQESDLRWARQAPAGPARSWWQIEVGTARDIQARVSQLGPRWRRLLDWHDGATGDVEEALLGYPLSGCVWARLLLWLDPAPLPPIGDEAAALETYKAVWRPAWALGRRPINGELERWSRAYVEVMTAREGVV